jgi:AraC-like DNA-binding protein
MSLRNAQPRIPLVAWSRLLGAVCTFLVTPSAGDSVPGSAQAATQAVASVPFTTSRISINGDLSEWDSAAVVTFRPSQSRGDRDNFVAVKLLWDNDKLYVAFIVEDTELTGSHVGDDEDVWQDDAVELFIDSKNDGDRGLNVPEDEFLRQGGLYDKWGERKYLAPDDYHFIVNVRNSLATLRGVQLDQMDYSWDTDILYAVTLSGTLNDGSDIDSQYVAELAIPWSSMGVRPHNGLVIGADFGVEDVDADGRHGFDWCDVGSFNKPYLWGDIVLVKDKRAPMSGALMILTVCVAGAAAAGLLLIGLLTFRKRRGTVLAAKGSPHGATIVEQIEACVERSYTLPGLSASSVARELGLSRRYLNVVLKQQGKPALKDLLIRRRIAKAVELLLKTDMSIAEIAESTGFRGQSVLGRRFKAEAGLSPTAFRKNPSELR